MYNDNQQIQTMKKIVMICTGMMALVAMTACRNAETDETTA